MSSTSIANQIGVEAVSGEPDTFRSIAVPIRLANRAEIAYGGNTQALCVHSACKTITKPGFHLYSVLGAFHGPTRVDRPVICRVTRTRDTKTFITRRVVASQLTDDGSERPCIEMFVDFHVLEPEMYRYSATPSRNYGTGPEDPFTTMRTGEVADRLLREGDITKAQHEQHKKTFGILESLYETRQCLDGVSGRNLFGLAKSVKTPQDNLPIHERTSAEWFRLREPLSSEAETASVLAFIMDGALSFLPLNLDKKGLEDAGPCSTLDFSLRIMQPDFKLHNWHLRERRTIAAAVGRSFSESRVWDEQGNLICIENQSCIIRPPQKEQKHKAKI